MTAVAARPTAPLASPGRLPTGALQVAIGLVLLSAFLRLWQVESSYELFIDEVTYSDLGQSVARGDGVVLHGEPFFLHPAGLFVSLSLALHLLGLEAAELADVVYVLRWVPALFGSLTPALVALLVQRVTRSWPVAVAGGLLLALEPFLIRFDSRVLLEAQAMAFAVAGFLVLTSLVGRDVEPVDMRRAALAGVLMLGSLLTKETYAFVTGLPVVVVLVTGLAVRRRLAGLVLLTTVVGYLWYMAAVFLTGSGVEWFAQKTVGVRRLLGLLQITGFNQEGHGPSLNQRILVQLANFAATYAVIGAAGLATLWLVWLLWRDRVPADRRRVVVLVVVWALCAQAHVGYALTIGTLEEQMFYPLVATGVPVLCVATHIAITTAPPGLPLVRRMSPRAVQRWLAAGLAVALLWNGAVWWRVHTTPDDAYRQFLAWAEDVLVPGTRIAVTDETTQFVLDEATVVRLETGREVREFRAHYVLIVSELVAQGYSRVDEELLNLARSGRRVFSASGRTAGRVEVYDVSAATQGQAQLPPARPEGQAGLLPQRRDASRHLVTGLATGLVALNGLVLAVALARRRPAAGATR